MSVDLSWFTYLHVLSLKIPPDESKSDEIRIEGSQEAVKAAKTRLDALVKRLVNERVSFTSFPQPSVFTFPFPPSLQQSVDLHIDQKWHSLIIGAKGATLKDISTKYPSVSINFPHKDEVSNIVK